MNAKVSDINCANEACQRNLRKISPVYTTKEEPHKAYCSRTCRATKTGEEVRVVEPIAKPEILAPSPHPVASKKAIAKDKPVSKIAAPSPVKRNGSAAWNNLTGKLFKTGKKPPNFAGNRKTVWEAIKDGMTVQQLYDTCNKAGVDGKSNLAKIIGVYGCAEVR